MSEATLAIVPRQNSGDIISTQEMKAALQSAKEQQAILGEFVKDIMTEGIDYGTIPGTERIGPKGEKLENRTLLKPGAEKLIAFFRCWPRFQIIGRTEDLERGVYAYKFRCRIYSSPGNVVAEGYGSASSLESKHRWRNAQRVCPKCKKPAIQVSKYPDRNGGEFGVGSFYCNGKQSGCGAKFLAGDREITEQKLGRIENPDPADVQNSVLKMGKKRAMVDGALALARCSDMFGQDLEDMVDSPPPELPKPQVAKAAASKPVSAGNAPLPKVSEIVNPRTGEILTIPDAPSSDQLSELEQLLIHIREAETLGQLTPLAAKCKARPDSERTALRAAYQKRMIELETAPAEPGTAG